MNKNEILDIFRKKDRNGADECNCATSIRKTK